MNHIDIERQYETATVTASAFWDWRHKLMTFTFTGVAALLVAFGWLVDRNVARGVADMPLVMAAFLCVAARMMDARVGEALRDAYSAGSALEIPRETADGPNGETYGAGALGSFAAHRHRDLELFAPLAGKSGIARWITGLRISIGAVVTPQDRILSMTRVLRNAYGAVAIVLTIIAIVQATSPAIFRKHDAPPPASSAAK